MGLMDTKTPYEEWLEKNAGTWLTDDPTGLVTDPMRKAEWEKYQTYLKEGDLDQTYRLSSSPAFQGEGWQQQNPDGTISQMGRYINGQVVESGRFNPKDYEPNAFQKYFPKLVMAATAAGMGYVGGGLSGLYGVPGAGVAEAADMAAGAGMLENAGMTYPQFLSSIGTPGTAGTAGGLTAAQKLQLAKTGVSAVSQLAGGGGGTPSGGGGLMSGNYGAGSMDSQLRPQPMPVPKYAQQQPNRFAQNEEPWTKKWLNYGHLYPYGA